MTEISAEAKRLFERARADFEPTQAQVAALDAAIAARIAAGGGSTSSGQGGGSGGGRTGGAGNGAGSWPGWVGSSVVAKAMGAGALVGLVAVGLAYRSSRGPTVKGPQGADVAAAPVVTPAKPLSSAESAGVFGAPSVPPAKGPQGVDLSAAPLVTAAKPSSSAEIASVSGAPSLPLADLPSVPVEPRTKAGRAWAAVPRVTADVGSSDPPGLRPASGPSASEAAAAAAPPLRATLTDEIRLVRGARAALDRGDAAGALAITEEHDSRYPRGTLREENLALKARALCALGRPSDARSAAMALVHTAPDSPYRAGLRASCVGPHLDE